MLPIPSKTATVAFAGCVAALVAGLAGRSPLATLFAGGLFFGLACMLALSTTAAARLRRERLAFRWALARDAASAAGGALVSGVVFEVHCTLYNASTRRVPLALVAPVVPDSIELLAPSPVAFVLEPQSRTELAFRLKARACGRVVLPGVAAAAPGPLALFAAPLYFPSPLAFDVLPRAALRRLPSVWPTRALAGESPGVAPLRRPGGGSELREIREHRSGDPFKAIAWKASARAGRLMVRELEAELQETHVVVLDVSGSMRGDLPGARKLDRGIELAALLTREALERGNRAGLVTVDGRVLARVAPRAGRDHALAIYRALVASTAVVDTDLTDVADEEIVALVGRHLRHQEGREFERDGRWDEDAIAARVAELLPRDAGAPVVDAPDPRQRDLRAFCRERGIPLAYRAQTRDFAKGAGLALALRDAAGRSQSPRTLFVVTDLDDVGRIDALAPTLAMLRARRHALVLLFMRAAVDPVPEGTPLASDLYRIYAMQERRRWREAREALARQGVALVACDLGEAEQLVARRAFAAVTRASRRAA